MVSISPLPRVVVARGPRPPPLRLRGMKRAIPRKKEAQHTPGRRSLRRTPGTPSTRPSRRCTGAGKPPDPLDPWKGEDGERRAGALQGGTRPAALGGFAPWTLPRFWRVRSGPSDAQRTRHQAGKERAGISPLALGGRGDAGGGAINPARLLLLAAGRVDPFFDARAAGAHPAARGRNPAVSGPASQAKAASRGHSPAGARPVEFIRTAGLVSLVGRGRGRRNG